MNIRHAYDSLYPDRMHEYPYVRYLAEGKVPLTSDMISAHVYAEVGAVIGSNFDFIEDAKKRRAAKDEKFKQEVEALSEEEKEAMLERYKQAKQIFKDAQAARFGSMTEEQKEQHRATVQASKESFDKLCRDWQMNE